VAVKTRDGRRWQRVGFGRAKEWRGEVKWREGRGVVI